MNSPHANHFPVEPNASRSVSLEGRTLLLVRRNDDYYLYENLCPHTGETLDPMGDSVLDEGGQLIVCQRHGAQFVVESGECVGGPCIGECLIPVAFTRVDDALYLD